MGADLRGLGGVDLMDHILFSPIGEDGKVGPQILKKVSAWGDFLDRAFYFGTGLGIGLLIGWII